MLRPDALAKVQDFAWFHKHLRIADYETGQVVPFVPNEIQWRIRSEIVKADQVGKPARLIILKSRRVGCSTIIQSTLAHRAFTRPNYSGVTIAHERDNAAYLHSMAETMYSHLPSALQVGKAKEAAGRFLYLANGSTLRVDTAMDKQAGRGMAARFLHASEVAFWPDAKTTMVALRQIIPRQPGTAIVIESTANGVGDYFHSQWTRAESGASGYVPLFFGWHEFPHYRMPHPAWFSAAELDSHEALLHADYAIDLEQLWWRREWIKDELDGDPDQFQQEYPMTPEEAFLNSGRSFFPDLYGFVPAKPLLNGEIRGTYRKGSRVAFEEDAKGKSPLTLYELPREGHRYVLFMDVAGTITPREYDQFTDKRDAEDYTVGWVVDLMTGHTVAVWHGRMDVDLATEEIAKLAALFHRAIIAVEMNGGYGSTPIYILRKLGCALYRPREERAFRRDRKGQYGWTTTDITRPLMLDGLKQILRETPHVLKHAGLKKEMATFVIGRSGRPEADVNAHDDLVMAAAGAYVLYRELAQQPMTSKRSKSTYVPSVSQR